MEKAIKHLKWRFGQDRITVSQNDINALNEIIAGFNEIESKTLSNQNLFIKLFIDNFLKQTSLGGKTSKEALREIERLLAIPVQEYYQKMREEIPYLRFELLLKQNDITPLYEIRKGRIKVNNSDAVLTANKRKIQMNQKILQQALTKEYTEKELKNFLDSQMFKLILKYSKHK